MRDSTKSPTTANPPEVTLEVNYTIVDPQQIMAPYVRWTRRGLMGYSVFRAAACGCPVAPAVHHFTFYLV